MSVFRPKREFGEGIGLSNNLGLRSIQIAIVESITDETDSMRISARIQGIDGLEVNTADLPYATPFLPMHLNVMPKVGEAVKIILYDLKNGEHNREWIGPVISQPQSLKFDPYRTATSSMSTGFFTPQVAPTKVPEAEGLYPQPEDVAIQGRDNSDIVLKTREVLIRAGKFVIDEPLMRNETNPSYINLKLRDQDKDGYINIVSDNINLISHKGDPTVDVIITDEEIDDIQEELHPLVFGDNLIEFLELVQDFINLHTHPYHSTPPTAGIGSKEQILTYDLQSLVSKNVKTN